ncbi:hypothetical protein CGCSCA4_v000439 [Colletotrichum siamense]|uniref:Uncharacterized protein n=1 Tax=Colletotrichum siamense TaxID=690259 RepID=A0A9P5EUW2_COLSI|nr:hypothetical protein CGCSCA4_v000439 [Colletotrichum siamense]KAF4860503.1 hypothetical protein CGCSCA2_v005392 [Colletotrichum siamense]
MSTGPRLRLIRPWERQDRIFPPGILSTALYKSCSICDLFARSSGPPFRALAWAGGAPSPATYISPFPATPSNNSAGLAGLGTSCPSLQNLQKKRLWSSWSASTVPNVK